VKLKTGTLVVVAGLGLFGAFGCGEDPNKAVSGPVNAPADLPKTSEDAAKAMLKNQQNMYPGRGGAPGGGGSPGGAVPGTAK